MGRKGTPMKKETIWQNYRIIITTTGHMAGFYMRQMGVNQLPCPVCFKPMDRGNQYSTTGNDDGGNIDHANGDHDCNELRNLQPCHYVCNVKKGRRTMHNYRIVELLDKMYKRIKKGNGIEEFNAKIKEINFRFSLKPEGFYIWS